MQSIRDEDNISAPPNSKRKNTSSEGENSRKHLRCSHSASATGTSCINCYTCDEMEDDLMFTCLPAEIILHVLHYLPLRDRKSVRLTCKSLNEYSKHVSFTRKEKFVFKGSLMVSSTSLVHEVLSRTISTHLNLEFREPNARIDSLSADFFKTCGVRVRSLSFYNCFPNALTLENIFLFCGNLEVIEADRDYYFMTWNETERRLPRYVFEQALDRLIQLKIERRTRLHTIKFDDDDDGAYISGDLLRKIFIVFPNVKHLYAMFRDIRLTTECLKPFTQLQSLSTCHAEVTEPIFWLELQTLMPELPMRLTEFRSHIYNYPDVHDIRRSSLLHFIATQTELEVFSLSVSETYGLQPLDAEWRKQVMFHVLRSCRKLREFSFSSSPSMFLDSVDEVAEYLNLISKLKRMKLKYLPETPDGLPLPSYMIQQTNNLALSRLETETTARSEELLRHILKSCPRMQHLFLRGEPTDGVLMDIICRSMPELRTLRIRMHDDSSGDDVFDDAEGIRNLESLQVSSVNIYEELPIKQFQNIQFWRLKHLRLEFTFHYEPRREVTNGLCKLLWNMPVVETVELPSLHVSHPNELLEPFKNSKNLRSLRCGYVSRGNARLLFKTCPSLKFVSHDGTTDERSFTYDSLTEGIISESPFTLGLDWCFRTSLF